MDPLYSNRYNDSLQAPDGHPVITDTAAEGIWLALWERAGFTAFLQQHGGSVAALTEHLRSQADQINADTAPQ
jgi:ABC-type transporter MlaC component